MLLEQLVVLLCHTVSGVVILSLYKATMNDLSNIFSVKVDLNAKLQVATDTVVLGLYDSYLSFEYNEYGEVIQLTPSSAPPLNA